MANESRESIRDKDDEIEGLKRSMKGFFEGLRVVLFSILCIGAGIGIQYVYDRDDSFHVVGFFLTVLGVIGLMGGIVMASSSYAEFQRCNERDQFATRIETWATFAAVFIFAAAIFVFGHFAK